MKEYVQTQFNWATAEHGIRGLGREYLFMLDKCNRYRLTIQNLTIRYKIDATHPRCIFLQ